jgi:putative hydrolase of the HAD superfamily
MIQAATMPQLIRLAPSVETKKPLAGFRAFPESMQALDEKGQWSTSSAPDALTPGIRAAKERYRSMNIKGALIDFGDTLAYLDKGGNRKYQEELLSTARIHGYRRDPNHIASALEHALRNSTKGELKNLEEFWKLFLKRLGISKQTALMRDLERVRRRHSATVFKLYDQAVPVLSALHTNYKLALVSNCAIGTSDVIEALGLSDLFECIILSYEVAVRKPDRRIYLEALRKLDLQADECIFVADEISDLEGAQEIGLKTLLVRQGSMTNHEAKNMNFKPDCQCSHISEITAFFK